ncbi:MAG: myo-inositol-1(or 4)-monophosphatase [Planctomycetota bacterium]|jgi:myo-inositol-1(or 4)-monophosphatase
MAETEEIELILLHMERIARAAGVILMDHLGQLKAEDVDFKGSRDLLTKADRTSEEFIVAEIQRIFPNHDCLAEESGDHSGSNPAEDGFLWIVDPLDGTTNFVHQIPMFAVSLGVLHQGIPVAGCVFAPRLDELFLAGQGLGTTLNGVSVEVSKTTEMIDAMLSTGFAYKIDTLEDDNLDHFARLIKKTRAIRRCGSAALDMAYTACGRFDGFWELHLSPWDVAGGAVLIREAGGEVTDLDGGENWLYGGEIVAGNATLAQALRQELRKAGEKQR